MTQQGRVKCKKAFKHIDNIKGDDLPGIITGSTTKKCYCASLTNSQLNNSV